MNFLRRILCYFLLIEYKPERELDLLVKKIETTWPKLTPAERQQFKWHVDTLP